MNSEALKERVQNVKKVDGEKRPLNDMAISESRRKNLTTKSSLEGR